MSKYEELCRAYAESVERQGKYINECCEFATFLANGIAQHFELPRAQIGFVTDRCPDRVWQDCNSVVAQLKTDGYLYFEEEITFYDNPTRPERKFIFTLRKNLKKLQDSFLLEIIGYNERFMLTRGDEEGLKLFYESLFKKMKAYFDTPFLDFTVKNFLEELGQSTTD
jgi:hypothetical protein